MEKISFLSIKKAISMILLVVLSIGKTQADQSVSAVSFRLWALVDGIPSASSLPAQNEPFYSRAVNEIKQAAPYAASAAVYGWRFVYTPSDASRGVKEYFECELVSRIAADDKKLRYRDPYFEEGRLFCRVEYQLDDYGKMKRREQQSLTYKKISGTGFAEIAAGVSGMEISMCDAVKNAVRDFGRSVIKNKPKEISGFVTLAGDPGLYLRSGKYTAELDFFLFVGNIIYYTVF